MSERVNQIFTQGWGNEVIAPKDIDWILQHLKGVDLGEESPWLEGYLKNSGVVTEYHKHECMPLDG